MWQSENESCDVCQCSRLLKKSFQLNENYNMGDSDSETVTSNFNLGANKENQHFVSSPAKGDTELSFYGNSNLSSSCSKCSSALFCSSPKRCRYTSHSSSRQPLEEFDLNSQDSGYSANFNDKETKILSFVQSRDAAGSGSSKIVGQLFSTSSEQRTSSTIFHSFSSNESLDDGFLELVDFEHTDENTQLPENFSSLLSGSLIKSNKSPVSNLIKTRPAFRRSISLKAEGSSPLSRARNCLFKPASPELFENRSFKRPEPPSADLTSPVQKRYKFNESIEHKLENEIVTLSSTETSSSHPRIQRSFSASAANIMSAVQRSSTDPDLIGDFSKPFCLPLIIGRHQDLKSISPTVLAALMYGNFEDKVASFKVIDCRYPYEYDGGHINGALNFYTKEQILQQLVEIKSAKPLVENETLKRNILVFHCEFSSERGPNLSRFLRNLDRTRNNESYPALHYPEIYLLDGGYKSFYEQFPELCQPIAYKPMLDPAHENDLRHFRAKSKTWNADTRGRQTQFRTLSLKRLEFRQ